MFASGKRGGGGSCGVLPEQNVADAYLRVGVERAASYPVTQSFSKRNLINFSSELFRCCEAYRLKNGSLWIFKLFELAEKGAF